MSKEQGFFETQIKNLNILSKRIKDEILCKKNLDEWIRGQFWGLVQAISVILFFYYYYQTWYLEYFYACFSKMEIARYFVKCGVKGTITDDEDENSYLKKNNTIMNQKNARGASESLIIGGPQLASLVTENSQKLYNSLVNYFKNKKD